MSDLIAFLQPTATDTDVFGNTIDNVEYNRRYEMLKTFINVESYPDVNTEQMLQLRSLLKYIDPKYTNAVTYAADSAFNLTEMLSAYDAREKTQTASLTFWENAVKSGSNNFALDLENVSTSSTYPTSWYKMFYTIPNETKTRVNIVMCCGITISGSDSKASAKSTSGKVTYEIKFKYTNQTTEIQKRFLILFIKLYHIMAVCVNRNIVKLLPKGATRPTAVFNPSAAKLLSGYWASEVEKGKQKQMQYFTEPTFRIACKVGEAPKVMGFSSTPVDLNTKFNDGLKRTIIVDKKTQKPTKMTAPTPLKIKTSEEFVAVFTNGSTLNAKIRLPSISVNNGFITVRYNADSCEVFTKVKDDDSNMYATECDDDEYTEHIRAAAMAKYQSTNLPVAAHRSEFNPSLASLAFRDDQADLDDDNNSSLNDAIDNLKLPELNDDVLGSSFDDK